MRFLGDVVASKALSCWLSISVSVVFLGGVDSSGVSFSLLFSSALLVGACPLIPLHPLVWYTGAVLFLFSNFSERGGKLC